MSERPREFSAEKWGAIEAKLPTGVDAARLRAALERAHADRHSPAERKDSLLDRIKDYEAAMRVVRSHPDATQAAKFAGWIGCQMADARRRVSDYAEIVQDRNPRRSAEQYELLRAWQCAGGYMGYNTLGNRPYGPAIDYFVVANSLVYGGKPPRPSVAKTAISEYRKRFQEGAARLGAHGELRIRATVRKAKPVG